MVEGRGVGGKLVGRGWTSADIWTVVVDREGDWFVCGIGEDSREVGLER